MKLEVDAEKDRPIQNRKSKTQNRLSGFDDLAGFQAAGADANSLRAARDDSSHGLQVRVEPAAGAVVGLADAIAELRSLAADLAELGH